MWQAVQVGIHSYCFPYVKTSFQNINRLNKAEMQVIINSYYLPDY